MPVRDIMTKDVQLLAAHHSPTAAARRMRDGNIGSLPVAEGDRLVGYVTDRDLVVRGLAQGVSPDTPIRRTPGGSPRSPCLLGCMCSGL